MWECGMEPIYQGQIKSGKYNPYSGIVNNDNKTYLPTRMTTLGYQRINQIES